MTIKGQIILNGALAGLYVFLAFVAPHSQILQAWNAAPAIISAASALYSGYQQNKARQKQDEQMKAQQQIVNQNMPLARQQLAQSQQAMGPALSYYSGMLADPRMATAPEQNRINSLYAGQASNVRNMAPRGGYGPAAAENLRSQQRAATENVIQQGRPMAASALSTLGGNLGQLGYQGMGLGAGILGNVFQQGLQARQQGMQVGQMAGTGLFNAYQSYLLNRATQPSGGGSEGASTYTPMASTYDPGSDNWQGFYGGMNT